MPLHDALNAHRTEYIYFRTDHHWTALGAYYAYVQFCNVKGITPHDLSDYEVSQYAGFWAPSTTTAASLRPWRMIRTR